MQCPFCGQDRDKVIDSRSSEGGSAVRRRRKCQACGRRFTTYERAESGIRLTVVKKDGARQPYDRDKLIHGLQRACYKRTVSDAELLRIVQETEEELLRQFDREVPSVFIGDVASRLLRQVDPVAYVRFASVYRNFADLGELIDEATEVRDSPAAGPEQPPLFEPTS